MVLLHQDKFDELYDKVKTKTCATDSEVIAFVSMDTDALCACRMLTVSSHPAIIQIRLARGARYGAQRCIADACRPCATQELFKYDHIRFAIHPIDSYNSLQLNFRELLEAQPEVRPVLTHDRPCARSSPTPRKESSRGCCCGAASSSRGASF